MKNTFNLWHDHNSGDICAILNLYIISRKESYLSVAFRHTRGFCRIQKLFFALHRGISARKNLRMNQISVNIRRDAFFGFRYAADDEATRKPKKRLPPPRIIAGGVLKTLEMVALC